MSDDWFVRDTKTIHLECKCIECKHHDSIDFHLGTLSLLLDQNSYPFDDNLNVKMSSCAILSFKLFCDLPKHTGQHSPFFNTGVVQFFNSDKGFS